MNGVSAFEVMGHSMDDLQCYIFFKSISVMSEGWVADDKRLYAMEPCLYS